MYRFWITAVLAIAIAAPSAHAARTKTSSVETVSGKLTSTSNGNTTGCANEGFAAICESGDCVCMIYDGSASGALGKGAATIFLNIDVNDPTSSPQGCYPVYARVEFANQVIGVTGAACGSAARGSFPGGILSTTGNYVTAGNTPAAGAASGSVDMSATPGAVSLTLTPPKK